MKDQSLGFPTPPHFLLYPQMTQVLDSPKIPEDLRGGRGKQHRALCPTQFRIFLGHRPSDLQFPGATAHRRRNPGILSWRGI